MRRIFSFALPAHLLLACALLAGLSAGPSAGLLTAAYGKSPAAAQTLEALTVVTQSGRHVFSVEVMRTDEERARGLMQRHYLPADRGMLFDFKATEPVSMWMKNTYIPLDMLFIRPDGTIARIERDTEPESTRIIPSGEPVLGVLEVNAGTAARIGAKPGDRIEHAMFKGH